MNYLDINDTILKMVFIRVSLILESSHRNESIARTRHIRIYFSKAINIALHGEPSAPDKLSGVALKK